MTRLYRFIPCLLLVLFSANVLFYVWFAGRTREASAQGIVQKAYVVSRLISDSAARSIAGDELSSLDNAVQEAFKDRHIVSVTIVDRKGKVLFESAVTSKTARLSSFETPVQIGNKPVGTLLTRFATGEEDHQVTATLMSIAALQLCLFAAIAGLLSSFYLRERGSRRGAGKEAISILPQSPCLVEWRPANRPGAVVVETEAILAADLPSAASTALAEEPVRDLFNACSSLQKAAELLSIETNRHQLAVKHSRHCFDQIGKWQQQTLQATGRADLLIATGRDIIDLVNEQYAASTDAGQQLPVEMQLLKERLVDAIAVVEMADDLVCRIGMELVAAEMSENACGPDGSVAAAAEMVQEGVAIIQERAFPAFAEVMSASDNIADRLSALMKQIYEFGDRSCDLALCGAELFDLAEATRLLRRAVAEDKDPAAAEEDARLNLVADRLEVIAANLKDKSQGLLGAANEAAAMGHWTKADLDASRELLTRAGNAVEDAAAAAIVGGDSLTRVVRRLGNGRDNRAAGVLAALTKQLQEVRRPLAEQVKGMMFLATEHERKTVEHAQSLEVARETLCMAVKYITEIFADTALVAAATSETAAFRDERRLVAANIAIEQHIGEACASLLKLLPDRDEEEAKSDG